MHKLIKQSRPWLVAGLLAVAVGCGASSSSPEACVGGHGGGAAGHGFGGGGGGATGGGPGGGAGGVGGHGAGGAGGTSVASGGAGGTPTGGGGMAGAGAMGIGGAGGDGGPIEFTDFVNDLIKNKTASNTSPETVSDKTFKDSMNPAAFSSLFP